MLARLAFACGLGLLVGVTTLSAQSIVTQPPLNTFRMSPALVGQHPRLYFTSADTAAIRQKAQGSGKWFYDKAKSDFGGYVHQRTPDNPGTWKDYLFGFWGQFSMCMFYVVEHDTAYANCARSWALFYAGRTDWLADDLVPMDITSGMALTYDILYNYLTPAERTTLRAGLKRSLDTMMVHFFQGEYWTEDYQNNHMHNRIHGIAHAAFAMYGDDPNTNVQASADLALGCYRQVIAWASDDGSTHEGAGYWDYGYHWVARTAELIKHVTGTDPSAGSSHFDADYLYRLYMCTPGWTNTFCIGDANEGAPGNADAWLPGINRTRDASADSVFRRLMRDQPGGFYQHTMWSMLWYDATLTPQPYTTLPLWHFWPDLEMFSIRSSWADTATAFVFKCGPPGGNKMQQIRGTNYINVAHDHPDQNHFLLYSNGRMLAQDDGYPTVRKLTRSHNTITVDTLGQLRDDEGWYQPFDYNLCGHLDDVMLSGSSACAAGNASKLYANLTRFVRHIAFVEGGYVISIDDLVGTGAGSHSFEWRLHKDGTWRNGQAGEFFVDDSAATNMRLQIRFLEPATAALQSSFLPAYLTAEPCVSVRTSAHAARITAVVVPQHNALPVLTSSMLTTTGGVAVQVLGSGTTDVFGVATDSTGLTASDITLVGTQVLVRKQGSAPVLGMVTRGNSLTVGGATILRTARRANLAWRAVPSGAQVEAEPSYKAAGSADTLTVGGLVASRSYAVTIDATPAGTMAADANGTVKVAVGLTRRMTVSVIDASAVLTPSRRPIASEREGAATVVYDARGAVVMKGVAGTTPGRAGLAHGVYYVKRGADGRVVKAVEVR